MIATLVRVALACLALALSTTAASAINNPIPGVDIIVKCFCPHHPPVMITTSTNNGGQITLKDLVPGDYVIEIDGKSLVAAMDRFAPPTPARHDSGPSVSLGIGGLFGSGGSHHSNEGGGPAGGSHNDTHGGGTGGVGLGVNVPLGGDDHRGDGAIPATNVRLTLNTSITSRLVQTFSSETPYCRETAPQGMRIGFTVPEGGGLVIIAISQLAGQIQF